MIADVWLYNRSDSPLCDYQIVGDKGVIAGEHGIEDEAHARLLSASQELLEACQKLVHWHGYRGPDNELRHRDAQLPEIAEAMDAIDKATLSHEED